MTAACEHVEEMQKLQPGQDWVRCYLEEVTLRPRDGGWVEVDLCFEAGIASMRDHLAAVSDPSPGEDFAMSKGFPLGRWVAEMLRRHGAGELSAEQTAQIEALESWSWS